MPCWDDLNVPERTGGFKTTAKAPISLQAYHGVPCGQVVTMANCLRALEKANGLAALAANVVQTLRARSSNPGARHKRNYPPEIKTN
mmetsp:Transcript_5056/g.12226  ORF Transcript_5056/g.12226 Transcript_5056/m.12226 type:complete len:87 (-) Transcript_5056:61-321(-)